MASFSNKIIHHGACLECDQQEKKGVYNCRLCRYYPGNDWTKPDLSNNMAIAKSISEERLREKERQNKIDDERMWADVAERDRISKLPLTDRIFRPAPKPIDESFKDNFRILNESNICPSVILIDGQQDLDC